MISPSSSLTETPVESRPRKVYPGQKKGETAKLQTIGPKNEFQLLTILLSLKIILKMSDEWNFEPFFTQKSWTKGAPSWWKIGVENVGNSILWRRKEPNWHGLLTETLWQIRKLIFVGEMLPRGQNALRRSTVLPVTKCTKHWRILKSKTGEQFWFAVWILVYFHFALFSYLVLFWWNWPIKQFLRVSWKSLEKDIGASSSQPHLGCLHCSQSSPSKEHPSLFVFVHWDDLPSLQ